MSALSPSYEGSFPTHSKLVQKVVRIVPRAVVEGKCDIPIVYAVINPNTPIRDIPELGSCDSRRVRTRRLLVSVTPGAIIELTVRRFAVLLAQTTVT